MNSSKKNQISESDTQEGISGVKVNFIELWETRTLKLPGVRNQGVVHQTTLSKFFQMEAPHFSAGRMSPFFSLVIFLFLVF